MATNKQTPIKYKREKDKMEITGDPSDIKWPMWFDLVSSRLFKAIVAIIILITVSRASLSPAMLEWLKKLLSLLMFFVAVGGLNMFLLSG
jgi:hypothetical protein